VGSSATAQPQPVRRSIEARSRLWVRVWWCVQLIAGGIPDGDWPPYATNVVLELWSPPEPDDESEGDRQEPVVRVLYNGVPTTVKGCAAVGVDDASVYQWCPFSQWQVNPAVFSPPPRLPTPGVEST
jgi:hypothetical protein